MYLTIKTDTGAANTIRSTFQYQDDHLSYSYTRAHGESEFTSIRENIAIMVPVRNTDPNSFLSDAKI